MRTLVLLATYDERENLERIVDAIWRTCDVDILVVDDSSPDGTGEIADAIAARDNRMTVVHRREKDGVATAHVFAFHHAIERGYDLLVEMDADFSHSPADLPRLIAACADADVVLGSRMIAGGHIVGRSWWRNLLTRAGCVYARVLLRLPVRDCTGGFRCSRTSALAALDLDRTRSRGYGFQIELNDAWRRQGARVVEIPVIFRDRTAGRSKMSLHILVESFAVVPALRVRRAFDHPAQTPDAKRLSSQTLQASPTALELTRTVAQVRSGRRRSTRIAVSQSGTISARYRD
ncbi:MAG: polyprenol monophosphomannose synthase [Candidatus Dormibacteraeota bacterium]|nr:polyprenol monophosphomannose synthase [Candidatus Dormibacteraeota bacterium]